MNRIIHATCGSLGRVATTAAGIASTALLAILGGRDGLVVLFGGAVWIALFLTGVVIAGALGVHVGALPGPDTVKATQHQEQNQ